jgi:tripartite-type tricarboxylate transporter receptor subunit TctC
MKISPILKGLSVAIVLALGTTAAVAEWAPSGTLKLQIGFAAGGTTDTMGRVIAKVMKENTGWNIIAENKTGAGGVAMFTAISQMPPKGNVIGIGVNMPVLINLVKRGDTLPFDLDSFDYLATVSRAQLALVARADAPFDDLEGMIAYSKANGGLPIAFDAPPQKFLMSAVDKEAGAGFRYVSTKGGAENLKLILGGQVMVGFDSGGHLPYLKSGDLKMIASANDARHNYAPDVKTVIESGFEVYVSPVFYFATTAGTDPEAKAALVKALAEAIDSDEVKKVVQNASRTEVLNMGPEGTKKMMTDGLKNVGILFGN